MNKKRGTKKASSKMAPRRKSELQKRIGRVMALAKIGGFLLPLYKVFGLHVLTVYRRQYEKIR